MVLRMFVNFQRQRDDHVQEWCRFAPYYERRCTDAATVRSAFTGTGGETRRVRTDLRRVRCDAAVTGGDLYFSGSRKVRKKIHFYRLRPS